MTAEDRRPVEGCHLSISVPNEQIQAGQAVEVSLVFKNDGPAEVKFPRVSNWFDYRYNLIFEDDQEVPLTRFGKQAIRALDTGSFAYRTLASGNVITSRILINRLYDMSFAGRYTLEAFKELPRPAGSGFMKVVSNRITIAIED